MIYTDTEAIGHSIRCAEFETLLKKSNYKTMAYSNTGHFIVHAHRKTEGERFSTGVRCKTSF